MNDIILYKSEKECIDTLKYIFKDASTLYDSLAPDGWINSEYVLGLSVYDIFSNNHQVSGKDNRIYDLGSLRGSGGFIADFFNKYYPASSEYNYRKNWIKFMRKNTKKQNINP